MNLTIYQIISPENDTIIIANENIPIVFLQYYEDIKNSIIQILSVDHRIVPILKLICQSKKESILNMNNQNENIRSFTRIIIGQQINWIKINRKDWEIFIDSMKEYSRQENVIIEINNPINFKDKELQKLIKKALF